MDKSLTGNLFAMSIPSDTAAVLSADDAAFSMLDKEKRNKNKTNGSGTQTFYAVLQLGEGYRLIALLLSWDVLGPIYMHMPQALPYCAHRQDPQMICGSCL